MIVVIIYLLTRHRGCDKVTISLNMEEFLMKVKDLMNLLKGCNPDDDVVIEDERTKEVFKCVYCDYSYYFPKKINERKKVFIGASFEGVND